MLHMHKYMHILLNSSIFTLRSLYLPDSLMAAARPPTTLPVPAPALTSTPRTWTYCDLIEDVLTSEEDILLASAKKPPSFIDGLSKVCIQLSNGQTKELIFLALSSKMLSGCSQCNV